MCLDTVRQQETIGFNTDEKKKIQQAVKKANEKAVKNGDKNVKKVTFSSYVRNAALNKALSDLSQKA